VYKNHAICYEQYYKITLIKSIDKKGKGVYNENNKTKEEKIMALNMKKALAFVEKDLDKNWSNITFSYSQEDKESIKVTADVTLNGFDDGIMLIINGHTDGATAFRAVFDKLEATPQSLQLLNKFNDENIYFKAYIRDDGYLELVHFCITYDESAYKESASEFLWRVLKLDEYESMKQLSALTN
jgi:hypothetical protein